jgi:hypothetical protein
LSVQDLANAIAQNEGFNVNGSLPQTLNNPGDLMSDGVLESFPTPEAGWDALTNKLTNISNGNSTVYPANETLSQFANTYTGGNPTAAANIAATIGNGTTGNSIISDILHASSPAAGMAYDAANSATSGAVGSASGWLGNLIGNPSTVVVRVSVIIAGLVFIAGAIFSFDKVRETVVETSKTALKGAEIAG